SGPQPAPAAAPSFSRGWKPCWPRRTTTTGSPTGASRAGTSPATTATPATASTPCSLRSASATTWTRTASPGTRAGRCAFSACCAPCSRPRSRRSAPCARPARIRAQGALLHFQCCQVALALQPRLAVARALLAQQHVHQRTGFGAVVDGELDQAARVRVDGRLAQLRGVHLAQALEPGDVHRALDLLALDALEQQALLLLVERVEHLLAHVDAEQRRHRHEDVAVGDQGREM